MPLSNLTQQERLAVLEAQMVQVQKTQREIHCDVKLILGFVNRWKGMSAMLLLVGGAAGTVTGLLIAAADRVKGWIT